MAGAFPYYDPSQDPNANSNNYQTNPSGTNPNVDPNATPMRNPGGDDFSQGNGNYGYSNAAPGMSVDAVDVDPNQTTAGAYATGTQAGSQAAQRQAYNQTAALAQGKGPSLATQLLNQQAAAAMGSQSAMASSASGSQSALARRQAMMANAGTMQSLGAAGSTARAQEQLGAMQMQGQQAGQMRSQDQNLAAQGLQTSYNQAGLNLGQYGVNKGVQVANTQMAIQGGQDAAMAVGGLAMMASSPQAKTDVQAADMHLSEPGGGAHWIIREEPNFLLAANARTGEFRKILTAPLSPEEHSQAMKKHGAGAVGSPNPGNKYFGDLDMSNPQASMQPPPQMQQPMQPQPMAQQPMAQQAPMQQGMPQGQPSMDQRAQAYNQGQPMPTNTTPSPQRPAYESSPSYQASQDALQNQKANIQQGQANEAADMEARKQKAAKFIEQIGKQGVPQVGPPKFDAPTPQTFQFSGGDQGDNKAADADLGGSAGDDYSKAFSQAEPGFVKQPEQANTISSPPEAKTDIQPAEVRHGSDQIMQALTRPGEQGGSGYGLGARPMGEIKARPESVDYRKADVRTLSSMAKADQASGEWPKGDVDLTAYRGALEYAVDKKRTDQGQSALNRFDPESSDKANVYMPDKANDNKVYDLPPGTYNPGFVVPEKHMSTDQVTPDQPKPAPKNVARVSGAIAADLHLGGRMPPSVKVPKVRTPGVKTPSVRTPSVGGAPKVESALRKMSPYTYRYKNAMNQPAPSKPGSKFFGVMTTDVKKDPVTRNMVSGKGAKEKIAVPAATSFNLAAGAHLQKAHDALDRRVSLLEQKFGRRV